MAVSHCTPTPTSVAVVPELTVSVLAVFPHCLRAFSQRNSGVLRRMQGEAGDQLAAAKMTEYDSLGGWGGAAIKELEGNAV